MKVLILALTMVLAQSVSAQECFRSNTIRGWTYDSASKILNLRARRGNYEVTTSSCRNLNWADQIGFKSFSSVQVCSGDEVIALDAWGQVLQTCWIRSITQVN